MKAELPLSEAQLLAEEILELIKPFCLRCQIAGSIRREKPIIGDIEIVEK